MVKRTASSNENEPEQSSFELPSEKEHLLQVVDVFDMDYEGNKFNLDPDTVIAKLEVSGGDEEGRTLLQRMSINDQWKGFFATRLFLKAIGEPYKDTFQIDTENWIGRQFYAVIKHAEYRGKMYANINEYNYDKRIEQFKPAPATVNKDEIQWDNDK